jgi:predicted GTPase
MNLLLLEEAKYVSKIAKEGINEADAVLYLCEQELNACNDEDEVKDIIEQMAELYLHRMMCEKAWSAANTFIKQNKFIFN